MIVVNACAAKRRTAKTQRLFTLLLIFAAAMSAQEVLTDQTIIKMVKARLSESIILEKVRSSPGRYSLTSEDLIELARQGVPEKVILAMQAKQRASQSSSGASDAIVHKSSGLPHRLDVETQDTANQFWDKILTRCPQSTTPMTTDCSNCSYYYPGSDLERHIHSSDSLAKRANAGLTEYGGVFFEGGMAELSAADEANGIEKKASIGMLAQKWRERDPSKRDWGRWLGPSDPPLSFLDVVPHFGLTGLMVIELWEVKGQWYYLIPPEIDPPHQLIPVDQVTQRKISCEAVLHDAGLAPVLPPLSGNALTTRTLPDPNPNAPAGCEISAGTRVMVQSDDPLTGKVKVFVLPDGKRDSKHCSNFPTMDRSDLKVPGPAAHLSALHAAETSSPSSDVIKMTPVETTVSGRGLQLRVLPKAEYAVAFTVPANTAVIIDAKNPDGWLHVVAKQSKEHWTAIPPFYGWAPPGSFPKVP